MIGRSVIYCFAHAGALRSPFAGWHAHINRAISLVDLDYPGHGNRLAEPLSESIEAIAARLVEVMPPFEPSSTVFFGHSMGCLVAYEVCRQLYASGLQLPASLIVSGRGAPQVQPDGVAPGSLPDVDLIDYLRMLGGTPEELLGATEIMDLLLPIIRTDLNACQHYSPSMYICLPLALHVYAGEDDNLEPLALLAWARCVSGSCSFRTFPGGHFYFRPSPAMLLRALLTDSALAASENARPTRTVGTARV